MRYVDVLGRRIGSVVYKLTPHGVKCLSGSTCLRPRLSVKEAAGAGRKVGLKERGEASGPNNANFS